MDFALNSSPLQSSRTEFPQHTPIDIMKFPFVASFSRTAKIDALAGTRANINIGHFALSGQEAIRF